MVCTTRMQVWVSVLVTFFFFSFVGGGGGCLGWRLVVGDGPDWWLVVGSEKLKVHRKVKRGM